MVKVLHTRGVAAQDTAVDAKPVQSRQRCAQDAVKIGTKSIRADRADLGCVEGAPAEGKATAEKVQGAGWREAP